jgi:heptaprenyl diphosphate synthase
MATEALDPLERARALVQADFDRFEAELTDALQPQQDYLSETEYELYRRGKKLRPLLLLLSARLCAGAEAELPRKAVRAAVSLEMLHVATLIHDDIVDLAPMRRGLRTVFAERGTAMAVLIGDMQFIQAVRCFADAVETDKDMRLVRLVLEVGFKICCGELDELQTDPTWRGGALRQRYYQVVDRKTAALFGLACEAGANLVGARTRLTYFLSRFGRRFGRAFQIMDDIFDLVRPDAVSGKAAGTDLAQRRFSLPIIYALDELPPDHPAQRIMRGETLDEAELRRAVRDVAGSNGLLRAWSEARTMGIEAVQALEVLPDGPFRQALAEITLYVVNRGFRQLDARL